MAEFWQHARHDGHLDWSVGSSTFKREYDRVEDYLRFHRGQGFRLVRQPGGHESPLIRWPRLAEEVRTKLTQVQAGNVFDIRSEADQFSIAMRRMTIVTGGERVIEHAAARIATPYRFGVTDCSWLSEQSYAPEIDQDWVHNAHEQHKMFGSLPGYVEITRAQIKPGDLLFHRADAHVSIFLDDADGGRVWDTEPHGVQGPPGWGYIQPGVRIRPMTGNYYCNWTDVNGIGRVVAVNGPVT